MNLEKTLEWSKKLHTAADMVDRTTEPAAHYLGEVSAHLLQLGTFRKNFLTGKTHDAYAMIGDYLTLADVGYIQKENEEKVLGDIEFLAGVVSGYARALVEEPQPLMERNIAREIARQLHELATVYSAHAFNHRDEIVIDEDIGWGPTIRQDDLWSNDQ